MNFERRQLKEWEDTLNERLGRCSLKQALPKHSWLHALEAIETYRGLPNEWNADKLRAALKEAEIYVPRQQS